MALTPKQQRFVEEYLVDLNATAAYKRAGYTASGRAAENNASRLLGSAGVQALIQARRQAQSQRTEITLDRWLLELKAIAFADPRRIYNDDGTLRPIHSLDDAAAAVVAGIEATELFEGGGDNRRLVGLLKKVKKWDKLSALDKIGKHFGWLKDRVQVDGGLLIQTLAGVDEGKALGAKTDGNASSS